ncbi:MAG TPA: IS110 family transposase [Actinomycetota bacterium]|nr:IS110 family transposase [Actinomycetota bacterium]
MGFIGGDLRENFIGRIKGADPGKLLAVPIDVGKHSAAALVCDFWGEIIVPPFVFDLNERGFQDFAVVLARVEAERGAEWVRFGLEQAGHYHRPLQARLETHGLEISLFNPAQVKANRNQDLLASLKSDAVDLAAMAELLIRGKGRAPATGDETIAAQAALAAHRSRKVKARTALKNQIHANLDLVFPGLSGCFDTILDTKVGRLLIDQGLTPERVRRLGPERLRRFCFKRGVVLRRPKARQITDAAGVAFALSEALSGVHARLLAADVGLLSRLDREIFEAEAELAEILPRTPAHILTTLPRVAVVRASNYGGAMGDVTRFRNASQVYRLSGLVPRLYESAGKRRTGTHISREGKVELREAIIELGKALRQGHPDFARYAAGLLSRGKHKGVVRCALGQRANRVAFAMMRDQRPFDPTRW